VTIPSERTRALLSTRRLLADIATGEAKGVPRAVRDRARCCLRHYPLPIEVELIARDAADYLDAGAARDDIKARASEASP